ncbi:glycosyltransferase family 2 protein [Candidatus Margulisiibacteriota bacterium]
MKQPKVYIIILNWNGAEDTVECLRSLQKIDYQNYSVLVVDNASDDDSIDMIKREFKTLKIIRNNRNLGFAAGNNRGIKYALEQGADYLLLLNNDTVVEPDFLSRLVKAAENDLKIGIAGPKIRFYQSNKIWYAGGFLNKWTGFTYHRGEGRGEREEDNIIQEVDFVSGCAMLIKKKVVATVGYLDEEYYLGHEDAAYCLNAKKTGFKVSYVPAAKIWHKLSRSAGGSRSTLYLYYRTRNHLLFIKKLRLKPVLFWPKYIFLLLKRGLGSVALGYPKGFMATLHGFTDFYLHKWGIGNGDKYR